MTDAACPQCGDTRGEAFFALSAQPVLIGVLWPSAVAARGCRRGDIRLIFCPTCGFIWNSAFDARLLAYDLRYDNSLHYSPTFQRYTLGIVDRLVASYGLREKTIVDIGCGKGDFLALLCEAGENWGYGFDPAFEGERVKTSAAARISWSNEHFGERHGAIPADLVTARYVFEHIPDPLGFLRMLRRSLGDRHSTIVYFEVPDIDLIIRQSSVWDVIYEHCSYFSVESLVRGFARAGFDVLRVEETYGRQFIGIDARPARGATGNAGSDLGDLGQLRADVARFRDRQHRKMADWHARLEAWTREGRRAVAWGAGAKAVGFFNMMGATDAIDRVVDINPHKQGLHLAGTGQRIVAPEALRDDPPDVVVLMNPLYREEIAARLRDAGLAPELVAA